MRCEAMQMDRMAQDDRFVEQAGETARLREDIRRRMRRERREREREEREDG